MGKYQEHIKNQGVAPFMAGDHKNMQKQHIKRDNETFA